MYNSTYHNNLVYGSPCRSVSFSVSTGTINGVESLILTSNLPFFDELRYGCEPCSIFYGKICDCIPFGQTLPVYISDDNGVTFIPLRSKGAGYTIYSDQIQPYGNSPCTLKFLNCYDAEDILNDHINILSRIDPKHKKCSCSTISTPPQI